MTTPWHRGWIPPHTPTNLGSSGPTRVNDTGTVDESVQPRPAGFVIWSSRATGEVLAVAELGPPIAYDDHDPLLWEGDQA